MENIVKETKGTLHQDVTAATVDPQEVLAVSVVMPCLNEEEGIGQCVEKVQAVFQKEGIEGEIVVVDNGSTDRSADIASRKGARVIREEKRGYGNAYRRGFQEAKGKYLIMGDADDTYDFSDIPRFLEKLDEGYDLIMGSRFKGKILPGAMSWSHRYVGNPILSGILRFLFKTRINDSHCGMRALTKTAYGQLGLQTTGMEFASEMVIHAAKRGLKITEIPITYHPRLGESKLRSLHDAWRHMRFMLLYSPTVLLIVPGLVLLLAGLAATLALLGGPRYLFGREFDITTMIFAALASLVGFQITNLGFYARIYSLSAQFDRNGKEINRLFRIFNLERGLLLGAFLVCGGLLLITPMIRAWFFKEVRDFQQIRNAIFVLLLMAIGTQIMFSSFFFSMMGIGRVRDLET